MWGDECMPATDFGTVLTEHAFGWLGTSVYREFSWRSRRVYGRSITDYRGEKQVPADRLTATRFD